MEQLNRTGSWLTMLTYISGNTKNWMGKKSLDVQIIKFCRMRNHARKHSRTQIYMRVKHHKSIMIIETFIMAAQCYSLQISHEKF